MVSITKTLFRTALIGGLALGGLTLVVGPQRVAGGYHQVRHTVVSWFDDNVQDPVLLRQQLKQLKEQYPERLRKLTRALAEVEGELELKQFNRQVAVNSIEIAKDDLASLRGLVGTAQAQLAAYDGSGRDVLIRFQGSNISVNQAYDRAQKIKQSATNNQDKVAHYDRELEILETYRARLVEQKTKLDKEFTSFQNQLWHIQSQIDQIERNESLIGLMEECNEGLAQFDKFEVKSLDQLSNRLAAIQKEQDAIYDALAVQGTADSIEDRAREAMRQQESFGDVFSWDLDKPAPDTAVFPSTPVIVDESMVEDEPQVDEDIIARLESAERN